MIKQIFLFAFLFLAVAESFDCTVQNLYITVPARTTDQTNNYVPSATLFVRTEGTYRQGQPVVVLVHGTSARENYWRCIQNTLSCTDDFYTFAPDLRGHGQSQQTPSDQVHYTYEMFARDIYTMLQQAGIPSDAPIYWAGVSIGSSIGVEFNYLYPDRIARLVLFSYNPLFASPGCLKYGCIPNAISTPKTMLPEPCQNDPLLIQAQDSIAQNKAKAGPIIPNLIKYGWIQDQGDQLQNITMPTMVAYGTIDPLLGGGNSSWYVHKHIPNSLIASHIEKGHLFLISDWYNAYLNVKKIFGNAPFVPLPDYVKSLNVGCRVCPLVKPHNGPLN